MENCMIDDIDRWPDDPEPEECFMDRYSDDDISLFMSDARGREGWAD